MSALELLGLFALLLCCVGTPLWLLAAVAYERSSETLQGRDARSARRLY